VEDENTFIQKHGWSAFGEWHLGIDDEESRNTKGSYKFPYGDFDRVHRCGVLAAESRARAVQTPRHRKRRCSLARNDGESEDLCRKKEGIVDVLSTLAHVKD
jgi:hypothetical protein